MHIAKADISAHKKIEELCNALKDMGYIDASPRGHKAYYDHLVIKEGKIHTGMLCACNTEYMEGFIDCNAYTPNGTEEEAVRLLLELAQMRDDIDNRQWFYGTNIYGELVYQKCEGFMWIVFRSKFVLDEDIKRLSPLGLAQAVKDGRIDL